jgi:aspartyl-tRNA(Asn)/glutamyl-tRNA(Gln) amidotransferase subunit C
MSDETNVLRDDVAGNHLPREQAFANAPQHDDQFFEVPKVLE